MPSVPVIAVAGSIMFLCSPSIPFSWTRYEDKLIQFWWTDVEVTVTH